MVERLAGRLSSRAFGLRSETVTSNFPHLRILLALACASSHARADVPREEATQAPADAEAESESGTPPSEPEPRADATATVSAPLPATNTLDATAAGTAITLDHRPQSGETLRDVLVESPGARVMSTGAIGQFTTITLRGTELGQTAVLIDDVPIGGPEMGAVDLSLFPLTAFERVEVYRGGAPAWLGDGSVGGVVRLMPRRSRTSHLGGHFDSGSFGTFRGAVDVGVVDGPLTLTAAAGAFTSRQDFPYVDDNGTRFDTSDDRELRQRNADVTQHHDFVHARIEHGRTRVDALHLGVGRTGGFPGAGLRRTDLASQRIEQDIASVAVTHRLRTAIPVRIQARTAVVAFRNHFLDPYGTVGLVPSDTDDRTRVSSARIAAVVEPTPWLEATAVGALRHDRYDATNRASPFDAPPAHRIVPSGTFELRAHGRLGRVRAEARASYRVESVSLDARTLGNYGAIEHHTDHRLLQTGRAAFALSPRSGMTLSGSVFRGTRAPSVLELFGNRSSIVGNPELRPESGIGADASLVGRASGDGFCVVGELRGFVQTLDDVIVYVPTSQYQARADNLPRSRVGGLESSVRLGVGSHLDVVGTWNLMRTADADGYELPFRPRHSAYGRVLGSLGPRGRHAFDLRGYVDATFIASTFLAPKELKETASRLWLGMGVEASLFDSALVASFSARDVADRRGYDFLGYPLSGRSFTGSVSYRKNLP